MKPYNAPKTGKYITIGVLCAIAICFITGIVVGILDMKDRERQKEQVYEYLNRMCEPVEYGLDQKPVKYSCDNIIFNTK